MKKVTLILAVIAIMVSTNLIAQDQTSTKIETIAKEILKAYQTQDVELLKKHASGALKSAISKSYFEDKDIKKDIEVIKKWDGKIRGIGYEVQNMGMIKMYMASVYFTETQGGDEIYEVLLSNMNNQGWVMFGEGIGKEKKSEFDKLSKTLETGKPATTQKDISIEMANGDMFNKASVETAISQLNKMDDDNFFIILHQKNGDFMQFAYSNKGYDAQYSENKVLFEADKIVNKEMAIQLIKEYFKPEGKWKDLVKWGEI